MSELLAKIMARCVEEGECLLWTGPMANGSPQVFVGGKPRCKQARRVVYEANKVPLRKGYSPVMECRNPKCLNWEHMKALTVKQIGVLAAQEGKFSTPERRAAITAGKRKASTKLDAQKAADIRSCATAQEGATKYDIHPSMASRIRRGEAWAEVRGASVFTFRP